MVRVSKTYSFCPPNYFTNHEDRHLTNVSTHMAPYLRSHDTMPQFSRIAAVTGANKGIGLAIVRNLALQYPSSAFNNGPLLIYLCARDKGRGEDAVKALEGDAQLRKAKALVQHGGLTTVKYHGLDISKTKSILDFAAFLEKEHPGGIDMVVNNAGVATYATA